MCGGSNILLYKPSSHELLLIGLKIFVNAYVHPPYVFTKI